MDSYCCNENDDGCKQKQQRKITLSFFYFLEESQTAITFAAIHDKDVETYKAHKETVPAKERLRSVLYDQIYSKPFLNRKGFIILN